MGRDPMHAPLAAVAALEAVPFYLARVFGVLPIFATDSSVVVSTLEKALESEERSVLERLLGRRIIDYGLEPTLTSKMENSLQEHYAEHRQRLGELLQRNGLVSLRTLHAALQQQKTSSLRLGEQLIAMGVEAQAVKETLSHQHGYLFLNSLNAMEVQLSLTSRISSLKIDTDRLVICSDSEHPILYLVMDEPLAEADIAELERYLGTSHVVPALTTKTHLDKILADVRRGSQAATAREPRTLGALLCQRELITESALNEALEAAEKAGKLLGTHLIDSGILPERVVLSAVAQHLNVELLEPLPPQLPVFLNTRLTQRFATFNRVVPVAYESGVCTIAMAAPQDRALISLLKKSLGTDVTPVLSTDEEILKAIRRFYSPEQPEEPGAGQTDGSITLSAGNAVFANDDAINKVNIILLNAIIKGASDIHISPEEDALRVYYRVDGALCEVDTMALAEKDKLVTRIKIMGNMRIDSRHLTQSGRIVARYSNRRVDFRVSILPTHFGENVVLRLLDSNKLLGSDFAKLGMPEKVIKPFQRECERPQGIVLVTGPTGSGKTTTLYHVLAYLRKKYRYKSISTIENPIEYVVKGILQSEVNEARGLTYAGILKEKLRQDPDIIMVGEIRNYEEAKIAFDAALTGHLVLSTLHTNDGATTIRRLLEIGLEPYNVASGINCILSQRLARRNCVCCSRQVQLTPEQEHAIHEGLPDLNIESANISRGSGCDFCIEGYKGRVGIYEFMKIDAETRQKIVEGQNDSIIRSSAVSKGMDTLRMAGVRLAAEGVTSIEEVLSVTDIM